MANHVTPTVDTLLRDMANGRDCSRNFEVNLTSFVAAQTDDALLHNLLEKGESVDQQYLGFYGLQIYYRRLLQFDQLKKLFANEESKLRFKDRTSYGHLRTMFYTDSDDYYAAAKVRAIIEQASAVVEAYDKEHSKDTANGLAGGDAANLPGSQHAFVCLIVSLCERYEDMRQELLKDWGRQAKHILDEAIRNSQNYPKYFCTQGRLQALLGEYDKAVESIRRAISLEQPGNNAARYSLRIMQYQSHLARIQSHSEVQKLNNEVGHIRGSLMNNVEIIAFFSGVISFVIGSLNLAEKYAAKEAAGLIIILLGALLVVFNCFALLLHADKKVLPARMIVFVVSVVCIAGGLFLVL